MIVVHATCVSVSGVGVLLRGPSGIGKSDLALRLVGDGAASCRLVADDQVILSLENGALMARAPAPLAGLLEVRGVGVLPVPSQADARVDLVVDLVDDPAALARLPAPDTVTLLGAGVPRVRLWAFAASAPVAVGLVAGALMAGVPLIPPAWDAIAPERDILSSPVLPAVLGAVA